MEPRVQKLTLPTPLTTAIANRAGPSARPLGFLSPSQTPHPAERHSPLHQASKSTAPFLRGRNTELGSGPCGQRHRHATSWRAEAKSPRERTSGQMALSWNHPERNATQQSKWSHLKAHSARGSQTQAHSYRRPGPSDAQNEPHGKKWEVEAAGVGGWGRWGGGKGVQAARKLT